MIPFVTNIYEGISCSKLQSLGTMRIIADSAKTPYQSLGTMRVIADSAKRLTSLLAPCESSQKVQNAF